MILYLRCLHISETCALFGKRTLIGVGGTDWLQSPLPPNRTGGSPASGSPVSSFTSLRVDPLTQRRPQSYRAPALQSRRLASVDNQLHVHVLCGVGVYAAGCAVAVAPIGLVVARFPDCYV